MSRHYADGEITKERLLDLLEKKAGAYTPQWRFDRENPDLGTALAYVYASMMHDTVKGFERLPMKLKTEFFNVLHCSMKPVLPAMGYASFGLVSNDVEGTALARGAVLTTKGSTKAGEPVSAETMEDVYVTPGEIEAVFESWNKRDYIGCLYEKGDGGRPGGGFPLFAFDGKNLQSHELYIGHSSVFPMERGGEVEIAFYEKPGVPLSLKSMERFMEKGVAFEYSGTEGFYPFESCSLEKNRLRLVKRKDQPPWEEAELGGVTGNWLKIAVNGEAALGFRDFSFREMKIGSKGSLLEPDCIYGAGVDRGKGMYFPFGEQFGVYDQVYFAGREALSKKGAMVTLSFWREFAQIPLGYMERAEIDWKLIMPKSTVKVEREYDITIDRVLWEYFNGSGWVRLFSGKEYEDMFLGENGSYRQKKNISFLCPPDISPALVNGMENYYIRARIIKVNNGFKTMGQYIAPVLWDTRFEYCYPGDGVRPELFFERNNMTERFWKPEDCLGQMYGYCPVALTGDDRPSLYLGFTKPMNQGPVRFLAVMEGEGREKPSRFKWEYYGEGRFKEFHPVDETGNLGRTGLVTFNGFGDFSPLKLFGRKLWWIRLTDETEPMGGEEVRPHPFVRAIYMNSVHIRTVRSGFMEFFTVEGYEDEPEFTLLNKSVYEAQVWVDETGKVSRGEEKNLRDEGRLREKKNQDGSTAQVWVLWKETEDIVLETEERTYTLDRNEGILCFYGGKGRSLPAPGVLNGIQVFYSTAVGQEGNLPPGHVTGLESAVGFISRVDNPLPLSGGCTRESADLAMKRHGQDLRHRFRAVTPGDFEKLAMEASGCISRAACFTGRGRDGERKPGHVSLVLVPRDYKNTGLYFQKLETDVMEFMRDKLPAGLADQNRFHLVMPVFVEIQVSAEIVVGDFQRIFSCDRRVRETLTRFLDPVEGNFGGKGWEVGTLPERSQIDMVLKNTKDVMEVRNLIITGVMQNGNGEVNPEEMSRHPYVLPVSGRHRVLVQAE